MAVSIGNQAELKGKRIMTESNQAKLDRFVHNEVLCCVSGVVEELLKYDENLLCEILEAQTPVPCEDCDQCYADNAEECEHPQYREIFEWWAVSNYLGQKLQERGELVHDDFFGLTIWGRCTTGQAIMLDSVIEDIVGVRA